MTIPQFRFPTDATSITAAVTSELQRDGASARELELVRLVGRMFAERDRALEDFLNTLPPGAAGPPGPPATFHHARYNGNSTSLSWGGGPFSIPVNNHAGGFALLDLTLPFNPKATVTGLYIVTAEIGLVSGVSPVEYQAGLQITSGSDFVTTLENAVASPSAGENAISVTVAMDVNAGDAITPVANNLDPSFANQNFQVFNLSIATVS